MYNIYHFFASLVSLRRFLLHASRMAKWYIPSRDISYFGTTGFPTLALPSNPRGQPAGGELVGYMESKTYVVPPFKSHIPTGSISIDSLGYKKARAIDRRLRANGENWRWLPVRDVYYLIRGRRAGRTKVCLVHGSFFESVTCEQVVRKALDRVVTDCASHEELRFSPAAIDSLSRLLSREIFSDRRRQVANTTVDFRLGVRAEVAYEQNILDSAYYPAIPNDSLNLVIPYRSSDDFRVVWRYLKTMLTEEEWTMGDKQMIQHPFNGKFFVLSYAL